MGEHGGLPWAGPQLPAGKMVGRADGDATIYGANFGGNPDANRHLEPEGHERLNIRLVFGISL
jgi:hypothetical protein